MDDPLKLCRIVTVPQTFQGLLSEQLRCIVAHGIDLTLVSSPGEEFEKAVRAAGAKGTSISMTRKPAPWADIRSLFRLTKFLSHSCFEIVHSSTPKAGFLTAVAASLARVPVRIHTFTGQPWVELAGLRRRIPRECDRIIGQLTTQCYADSPSQRDFLVSEGLVHPARISVIGAGSISGVDFQRFSPKKWGGETGRQTRHELGIPNDALVVVFVGRVTKDKGVTELLTAFQTIAGSNSAIHLVLVGPFEPDHDPLPTAALSGIKNHPRIHAVGFSEIPEKFLGAGDIFCLPSYREGFGSVVIEAAAMSLPAVVTHVTGLVDAVIDNVTGLVVPPKNVARLVEALQKLAGSRNLRRLLGQAARHRAEQSFDSAVVNSDVVTEYFRLADRPVKKANHITSTQPPYCVNSRTLGARRP